MDPCGPAEKEEPKPPEQAAAADRWLRRNLARVLGHALPPAGALDPRLPLACFGLDSLAAIELQAALEADLGVRLSAAELLQASCEDLAAAAAASAAAAATAARREPFAAPVPPPAGDGDGAGGGDEPRAAPRRWAGPPQEFQLSHGQRALWFVHQLVPRSPAYNVAFAAWLRGEVQSSRLRQAFQALTDRHAMLRTTFTARGGEPAQRVHDRLAAPFAVIDAGALPDRGGREIVELLAAAAARPFDLVSSPPLRIVYVLGPGGRRALLLAAHHIAVDLWSCAVLMAELRQLLATPAASGCHRPVSQSGRCAAGGDLTTAAWSYADYVAWQRAMLDGQEGERLWSYWRQRLARATAAPPLDLPADRPRPPVSALRGGERSVRLDAAPAGALRALAAASRATLFTGLLAGFQALLGRLSGQTEVSVGVPASGRGRRELAGLVGYLANPLVLTADLADRPTGSALLARTRQDVLAALAHQDFPFPLLVERLQPRREAGGPPLFRALFASQNAGAAAAGWRAGDGPPLSPPLCGRFGGTLHLGPLELTPLPLALPGAQLDLALTVVEEGNAVAATLRYDAELFDGATAGRVAEHFQVLLAGLAAEPGRRVDELPMLAAAQRHQVAVEWDPGPAAPGREGGPGRDRYGRAVIHRLFAAEAERAPHRQAVTAGADILTYGELEARANRLAWHLLAAGVRPGDLVGVCLARTPELIVALLAALKAGAAYLPLDPAQPRGRLAFALADAGAAVVVTVQALAAALPEGGGLRVIAVDAGAEAAAIAARSARPPDVPADGELPAYVIHTSGSTGRPKGVVVPHGHVTGLFSATAPWFSFGCDDVWTLFHSCAFDFSVWEIWGALLHGGRLVVVPYWESRSPEAFYRLLRDQRVTVLNQTPTAFRQLIAAEQALLGGTAPGKAPSGLAPPGGAAPPDLALRLVVCGGEALEPAALAPWFERHGDERPQVVNMYGITETTVHATRRPIRRRDLAAGRRSVLGAALPDLSLHVVDGQLAPQPIGVPGEIVVGGEGVATGYLGRPELTAQSFIPDPRGRPGERLYRSGDLARRLPDGELEYLGRIDHQVKIRGFRVELGEIEALLARQPALAQAVVVAGGAPGDVQLVAYCVPAPGQAVDAASLRAALGAELPEAMVPSWFVQLAALPLTANGKVDRKALAARGDRADRADRADRCVDHGPRPSAPPPPTLAGRVLQGMWEELLGVDRVAADDDFFALGGHSLLAARLASRVREVFGLEMPVDLVFRAPTLAGLAAALESALPAAALPPLRRRGAQAAAPPLSFAQQRLWFLDRLHPGSPLYNMPVAVALAGRLSAAALAGALAAVVRRHEALRTRFPEVGGKPVQAIDPPPGAALPTCCRLAQVDLGGLRPGAAQAEADRLAGEEARRPFALGAGPLLRLRLLRLGVERHLLLLTLHHIVADGWSLGILLREVAALYEPHASLPEPPLQYGDFAVWQRAWMQGEALAQRLAHFRDQLRDVPALSLPVDRRRPALLDHRGRRRPVRVPAPLATALRALCRRAGATPFMALLAAFEAVLARHAAQQDFAVGVPVAGRTSRQTEAVVGLFANTVALRAGLAGDPSFGGLLAGVRAAALGAFSHQDLPFEQVVAALAPARDPSRPPLCQVMFALADVPAPPLELPGLALRAAAVEAGVAKLELTLELGEADEADGSLAGGLEYATALFDGATACRLADHFLHVLEKAAAAPDLPLSLLPLLGDAERHQLLHEWSGGASMPAAAASAGTVHAAFVAQAARTPAATALRGRGVELSFGGLATAASRLARQLGELGVGIETVVGVLLAGSAELAVSLLAVLEAGGAYLPLEPAQPPARCAAQLADAGAALLLTVGAPPPLPGWAGAVMDVAGCAAPTAASGTLPPGAPAPAVHPDHLAYVIYTSGSTGRPKGVAVPHRALLHLCRAVGERYRLAPGDRVLQFASPGFDVAAEELFATWLAGAAVVLSPDGPDSIGAFVAHLAAENVTLANLPAAFWHAWVAELPSAPPPASLRRVVVGSERMAPERLVAWRQQLGDRVHVDNAYGVTEAAVTTAVHDTGLPGWRGRATVPVGRPLPGSEVLLLDRQLAAVPAGACGELAIGGEGLARGYRGRPGLTAARFVPHPFAATPGARLLLTGDLACHRPDGTLDVLGRRDQQLKVRGVRVEPGEVEAALESHPGVAHALVGPRPDGDTAGRSDRPTSLVAWVVPRGAAAPAAAELRGFLAARLPAAMLPAVFVQLAALPLTASGKPDRAALQVPGGPWQAAATSRRRAPEPAAPRPGRDPGAPPPWRGDEREHGALPPPRTPAEAALAAVWARVLGLGQVGIDDNFFALGGDSILSLQVVAAARAAGFELTVREIFQHPTVARLASVARRPAAALAAPGTPGPPGTPAGPAAGEPAGALPLTPIQRWFFAEDQPDPHHFNQALRLAVREPLAPARLAAALQALVDRHASLRLRFARRGAAWRQTLAAPPAPGRRGGPRGSALLCIVDLAALPAGRRPAALASATWDAQAGFHLGSGLLFRAVLCRAGAGVEESLLLAAHHLAVDAVSWSILLGDLAAAYRRRAAPPPATTSFAEWARRLAAHARSAAVRRELAWWLAAAPRQAVPLPLDHPGGGNLEAQAGTVTVELSAAATAALLREVAAAYRCRMDEALLAALARAVARWTGDSLLWLDLEGHGREDLFPGVDLSRTVGWFTTLFPVLLDARPQAGPATALKGVKQRLRTVPGRGIGFGLLRYLSGRAAAAALAAVPRPEISFNYLGRLGRVAGGDGDDDGDDGRLFAAALPSGPERSPRARRTHLLEVRALLLDGRLRLDLTYGAALHHRATIERLADAMSGELRALIAGCGEAAAACCWTPSDFPLARLDQDALDRLLGGDRQVEDLYPLSPVQQGMLFHTRRAPRSGTYVEQLGWVFAGALDAAAWRRAWQWVTARHAVLRTAFLEPAEEPLQLVRPGVDLEWRHEDWSALAPARQGELLARRLAADRERGFELERAPLQRFALVELGGGRRQFLWSHHHLLLDGWSVALVLAEVLAAYEAFSRRREPALPPARPFRDHIAWLATRDVAAERELWRARLAGFTTPTPLGIDQPADREAAGPDGGGMPRDAWDCRRRLLTAATSAELRATARRRGWTPSSLVHAAWALLLARYAGVSDLVFGSVVSGRAASPPGAESLVGLLINTLPVRAELPDAARQDAAAAWLDAFQARLFEVQQHEATPLPEIQSVSGVPRRLPLFESIVAFENYPLDRTLRDGRAAPQIEGLFAADRTHYPLTLIAALDDHLSLSLLFLRRRFAAAAVERLAGHLETLLAAVAADPEQPLAALPLLAAAERHQLLLEHNDAAAAYPAAACVHELVAAQAARTPAAVAVRGGGETLRYGELVALSGHLARRLARLGVGPEVLVGVCADRTPALLVALLAVLEAGGAYLPLDPAHPRQRLGAILADAAPRIVLTERALRDRLPAGEAQIVLLDLAGDAAPAPARHPGQPGIPAAPSAEQEGRAALSRADPENLAYVIYTSGSTGHPKGVEVRHRGVVHYLAAMAARPGLGAGDVMLAVTTPAFDIAVTELLLPLTVGARIELVSQQTAGDPALLAAAIDAAGATCMQATPATWSLLLDGGWPGRQGLRALCGGEALPRTLADRLLPRVAELWNLYGPTETTVWSALLQVGPGADPVALGRPLANTSLHLLGSQGGRAALPPLQALSPLGLVGELVIGGEGLARGYHGRPDLTAERFVPDPFGAAGSRLYRTGDLARRLPGGELAFAGRLDHQVKIRGVRIELGEIEAVLGQHPMVATAVAMVRQDAAGASRLVAYVAPARLPALSEPPPMAIQAEHLAQWRDVYDQLYERDAGGGGGGGGSDAGTPAAAVAAAAAGGPAAPDAELDLAGWVSSYTGAPIAAAAMQEQVEHTAARILALAPRRVLEIGCGTGLLLRRIAPHCTRYLATDFSRPALDRLERWLRGRDLPQVALDRREAHDLAGIAAGSFDAVILNSVVQYFPGADYLVQVLQAACAAVAPGGCVFVGDVRSLPLLRTFHAAVQLEQAPPELAAGELRRRVRQRVQEEGELVLDPRFFDALREPLPQIASVVVEPRRGRHHNELTRFRYDVLLRLDPRPRLPAALAWQEWNEQPRSLPALRRLLSRDAPAVLALAGVPNARLAVETRALAWLDRDGPERPLRELRAPLDGGDTTAVDPEDLWQLAEELPYRVDVRWAGHDADGAFDVVLRRRGGPWDGLPDPLELCRGGAGRARGRCGDHANQPLAGRSARALAAALRSYLRHRLPDAMVPAAVVVLDELPLTASGKIDRAALPDPDRSAAAQRQRFVAPRTPLEETVAAIWRDVLGLTEIGVEDDFFALGGHSLLAGRLTARLRAAFGVAIELGALLDRPTLGAMAAAVAAALAGAAAETAGLDTLLDRLEGMDEAEAERLLAAAEGAP